MKRRLLTPFLKTTLLAVPAAAMMLGASQGAQIGINFWGTGYVSYNPGYAGKLVTATAFGIPASDWFTTPQTLSPDVAKQNTGWPVSPVTGGQLSVAWTSANTWSTFIGDMVNSTNPPAGDEQVTWGILDDTTPGWTVTLSGLRNLGDNVKIQLIAATGGSQASFPDCTAVNTSSTNILTYPDVNVYPGSDGGTIATSAVSVAYSTLSGNNSVTIVGGARNGAIRSSLAGIILTYDVGSNPPLVEANPTAPVGNIYPGDSFILNALASGSAPLHYQWRKDGIDIPGANSTGYTNSSAVVGNTGGYDVVVTNSFGAITSAVAQVTITPVLAPVITQVPLSQSLYQSYPATFTVAATGGQLSYQWKSNGVAIPDATNTSYTIPSVTSADAGTYTIEVNNSVGPVASASATLVVKVPVAGSYEAVVAGTKPAFWLRYSETGPKPVDVANNSGSLGATGNGEYVGSITHPVTGALIGSTDKAATLSGGKVSVPFNAAINPAGDFTVECWINPANLTAANRVLVQSMINGQNPGNTDDRSGWAFRQNGAALTFILGGLGPIGGSVYYTTTATSGNVLTAGVWQHVAAVYKAATTNISILLNGVEVLNTTGAEPLLPNYAAPLIVGDRGYGGWTYQGVIDEVAVYASSLTPAQLAAHYQNGTSASPSPAYNTLVTGDGAVEYLRLNEPALVPPIANSGTLGAAFNGSYNSTIVPNTVGPRPATYPGFESANIAVTMTNGYSSTKPFGITTDTVTMTCWIKREADFSTDDLSWLTWLGSSQSGGFHLNEATSVTPGELRYHWDGSQWSWGSGLIVPEGVWTFCAMVLTPTDVTMYMSDGDTLLKSPLTATHTPHLLDLQPGFGGGQQARIGRNYIGQMDESTVHFRALSQSEITTLFLVGTGAPFMLDIVPGGIIEDSKPVGTPHNGANYQTTWLASSQDPALVTRTGVEQFSTANNSQIQVAANPDFDSPVGTFTFWMKADAPIPGPGNEAAILVDRRTSSGAVIALNDAGSIFIQCAGGANTFFAGYLPDTLWHHVAVTYDQAAAGNIEIYVDGVFNGAQANTAAWAWPTAQPIEIGRSHDAYWKRYDGQMDDFRIYNRILTAGEITSIQTTGALVDTSALKLRFNFDTSGIGQSVTWPFGTLLSSPVLGPSAIWTPVPGATVPSYPFMPTEAAKFFRATP